MSCPKCGGVHRPYQCPGVTDLRGKRVAVTSRDKDVSLPVTARDNTLSSVTPSDMAEERHRLLDRLAEIEAAIGPMGVAERKRRQRARERAGKDG